MATNEQIRFRLFLMPCCGQMLCWVNPRLPNYCPECGQLVHAKLKTGNATQMDATAWLKVES